MFISSNRGYLKDDFYYSAVLALVALIYIRVVNEFLYKPIKLHRDWFVANGLFTNKPRNTSLIDTSSIEIVKRENLKSYSVADELLKWPKLKEDGHITDYEFQKAKSKILDK